MKEAQERQNRIKLAAGIVSKLDFYPRLYDFDGDFKSSWVTAPLPESLDAAISVTDAIALLVDAHGPLPIGAHDFDTFFNEGNSVGVTLFNERRQKESVTNADTIIRALSLLLNPDNHLPEGNDPVRIIEQARLLLLNPPQPTRSPIVHSTHESVYFEPSAIAKLLAKGVKNDVLDDYAKTVGIEVPRKFAVR